MIVGLLIGLLFFIAYWLSKKIAISIQTKGGMIMGLSFKRSVIENIPVDIQKAIQAITIINNNVIESQKLKIQLKPKSAQNNSKRIYPKDPKSFNVDTSSSILKDDAVDKINDNKNSTEPT